MTQPFPPPRDPDSRIPPSPVASPAQVTHAGEPRWYLPTIGERIAMLRWRILWFLPAGAILLAVVFVPFAPFVFSLFVWWWKLLLIAIGLPLTHAMRLTARGIQLKTNPFCIHCGYDLTGLPDGHQCPECGATFHYAIIDEYRRDPHWFIKRHAMMKNLPAADEPFAAGPKRSAHDGT